MDDRSDSGGAILAIGVVLILLLLLVGGGGFVYVFLARQQATVMAERALAAEAQARANESKARRNVEQAQQARAAAELAVAQVAMREPKLAAAANEPIRAAIEALLLAQAEAWNAGDIDRFMEHYWKSEELTFSASGQTTRGWTATRNRYRERYPTLEKMGRLEFDKLEITPLGETAALVLGQWHVEREPQPLTGNFSLVVRKVDHGWRIIHDHTSRLE